MAFFDSRESVFQLDDSGGTPRDISAFLTEISGIPGPRNLNEVTALGDTGAKFIPGLQNASISLSGVFDDTATTGPDVILGALRTHTSALDWDYGPEGKTGGDPKYSGTCWVQTYEIQSRVGNRVEWSATLQVEGAVTTGTY